ncbi:MAG TPA: aquaporin [Gaiellales bacterium]|nr:aquaporin [Gaiellales bacterium]
MGTAQRDLLTKVVGEAVGTFALIFVGAGSIVVGADLTGVAFAHGLVIGVMVCAVGHISGGHFNPAVTFGFWITKRIPSMDAVAYWIGQFAAAILAALLLKAALPDEGTLGRTVPAAGVGDGQALLIEFILTFFLGWVIFAVAVDERGTMGVVAGLPIGFVITFDVLMGGPLTGGSMNPARTLGPDLVTGHFESIWVYLIACPAGSAAAMGLYDWLVLRPWTAEAETAVTEERPRRRSAGTS